MIISYENKMTTFEATRFVKKKNKNGGISFCQ